MLIQRIETGEQAAGLYETYAASVAEVPRPLWSRTRFCAYLLEGSPGSRAEAWAVAEDGRIVAGYALGLPRYDNPHLATLFTLTVHPGRQRRGVGTALLDHAVGRARAAGRDLLITDVTRAGGPGSAFAAARGCSVALHETRSVLDLGRADLDELARLMPEPGGYLLERWTGPAADDLLPALAAVLDGMNDAPHDAGVEAKRLPVDRIRATEERMRRDGEDCYSVLARRASDGAPAGITRIYLDAGRADRWGHQGDTTVLKEHRGHRLGLLLKLSNLFRLRENEPGIDRIVTYNAGENRHMRAINEAMGFRPLDEWLQWRLPL
ncbi:GNAT family N-acetyltransferase [Nonomuraea sp. MCN248]|uniref:GNAT family N-acetyltransferase n=1 Tax=Nonomuraea corallina TaxID=2989783 RepID=A0ABT4SK11_9ACTN|nr:GNAT family N-acetyltransferase [Nonomuraea corallina]MDA0637551.1 GNAT family N-acetyltransferase [Nonomuraea corallina]